MLALQDEANIFGDQFIQTLLQLKDNHKQEDQQWFQKLLDLNSRNLESIDINAGLLINFTVLDSIIAKLLNLDLKLLAKIRVVGAYINQLWESNGGNLSSLNDFIMCENQARELSSKVNLPITPINHTPTTYTCPSLTQNIQQETDNSLTTNISTVHINSLSETTIKEIDMSDRIIDEMVEEELHKTEEQKEYIEAKNKVLGNDIKTYNNYSTRKRIPQTTNPFFLDNSGTYKIGALTPNIPGEDKKEQHNYIAHILRLPKDTNLLCYEFINGNYWITFTFKEIDDMIQCIEKINSKNKNNGENFKFHPLHPKQILLATNKQEKTCSHSLISSDTSPTTSQTKTSLNSQSNQKRKEKETAKDEIIRKIDKNKKERTNKSTQQIPENKFNLVINKGTIKAGILSGKMPGKNRLEQLNILAKVLQITENNDLISHGFHNGNSWLFLNFNNHTDFLQCVTALQKNTPRIDLILLSSKDNSEHKHNHITKIQILDIPNDFSTSRIKGAIKKYGSINTLEIKQGKNQQKSATVVFNSIKIDLNNIWSIPMGNIMARIAPFENHTDIFTQRNQFTTRLYGIRKDISATRIMSATKHTGAKTIHIPINSKTGKRRNFAIVGFNSLQDLTKAISSYIFLSEGKTWWSTKDNNRLVNKEAQIIIKEGNKKKKEKFHIDSNMENSSNNSSTSSKKHITTQMDWTSIDLDNIAKDEKKKSKQINRNENKKTTSSNNILDSLSLLTSQLNEISKRLLNLESNHTKMDIPVHNRS